jgi:hypothetical protein
MAIDGWTGATRKVPAVRTQEWDCETRTWIDDGRTRVVIRIDRWVIHSDDGMWSRDAGEGGPFRIHPDDLAALNALAARHGGTWTAARREEG